MCIALQRPQKAVGLMCPLQGFAQRCAHPVCLCGCLPLERGTALVSWRRRKLDDPEQELRIAQIAQEGALQVQTLLPVEKVCQLYQRDPPDRTRQRSVVVARRGPPPDRKIGAFGELTMALSHAG